MVPRFRGIALAVVMACQSSHSLLLQFVDTLYLAWSEELGVLLVVFLAQVEDFLTALHALPDSLLCLGICLLR